MNSIFFNYLVSPYREKYKIKVKGCLLCKIIRGKVKSEIIYKDKIATIILNAYPYNKGHLLIAPIRHVESIEKLTERELIHLMSLVRKSMKLLKKTFDVNSFNIGCNIGKYSGALVTNHLHIHVVPRYANDIGFMETTSSTRVMPPLQKIAIKLRKSWKEIENE